MLSDLPVELLIQVVQYVQTANTIRALSLTNRRLHDFVEKNGWHAFVRNRFQSISIRAPEDPSLLFWNDAAHGLTSLSRAWDKRALQARSVEPLYHATQREDGLTVSSYVGRKKDGSQTMGFTPVIDSYDTFYDSGWSDRREVVVWGAGAELVVRVKTMGKKAEKLWCSAGKRQKSEAFDDFHHRVDWMAVTQEGNLEGRNDITAINVLRPHQNTVSGEAVVVGRASGSLSLLHVSPDLVSLSTVATFDTGDEIAKSMHVNTAVDPLLSACFSDLESYTHRVAVYQVHSSQTPIKQISDTTFRTERREQRIRSSQFVSATRVVVGLSTSRSPVYVSEIAPDGIKTPSACCWLSHTSNEFSSVYALKALPAESQAGNVKGETFLSGSTDGIIRLFDLRAKRSQVLEWHDRIDNSPIYSLCPLAHERFIAGGARHCLLKVFDLRSPGGTSYDYRDASPYLKRRKQPPITNPYDPSLFLPTPGWNVFLRRQRHFDSPVYSLSSPSHYSPTLFAGTENTVIQIDAMSTIEKHPDPIFKYNEPGWFRKRDLLELTAYDQKLFSSELSGGDVKRQHPEGMLSFSSGVVFGDEPEWDERWATN